MQLLELTYLVPRISRFDRLSDIAIDSKRERTELVQHSANRENSLNAMRLLVI
jgi:hypothetical protein